ncbi:MAG: hypothetical protein ABMA13_13835 [Chthoniobacteraceae bacterium]
MPSISNPTWLLLGALAGYALMMGTNPVRECLRDGWRALRRYPALWIVFGVLGFANALFALGTRAYLAAVLPAEERPIFMWMRDAWQDPQLWLSGSPQSLWWLPHHEFSQVVRGSVLSAAENFAGLFDNLFSTFPLAAVFAPLLLLAWRGRANVLLLALRRRFGRWGIAIHLALAVSALAALAKPLVYATPQILPPEMWMRWGQVVAGVAFGFEYLFGVAIQVFLLVLAYAWVRGLTFDPAALIDVAIRRFTCVLQWSALVLLLGVVLIELPLMLKNIPTFAAWFPEHALLTQGLVLARLAIVGVIIVGAGVQVSLALHASSWRRAWREHLDMVAHAWWPLGWFFLIAFLHFFVVRALQENVSRGVGEGTALWVTWQLISPWLLAVVGGWLLASWVCVVQRFGRGTGELPELA